MKFKQGDVVTLNCGGPKMVVYEVSEEKYYKGAPTAVAITWVRVAYAKPDGSIVADCFKEVCLKKVK